MDEMNDDKTLEAQHCFVSNGYMFCNWKRIKGIPTKTKSGKYWKWFVGWKPKVTEEKQKETHRGDS